nr:Rrf2 family transcriptional regulator [Anaerolactibacter massiliensis]
MSFYDVYPAIEPVEGGDLFRFHEKPSPECPVGRNIHALLDDKLKNIQNAMEDEMKKYTIADLRTGMQDILTKNLTKRDSGEDSVGVLLNRRYLMWKQKTILTIL